uniref:Uncharacterized protein n=1 Tax=Arundo donax TaxID=35708 RepID=A0A0A8YKB6_ARUDO
MQAAQGNSIRLSTSTDFQFTQPAAKRAYRLQQRAPDPDALSGNMAAGDLFQRCTAGQHHGDLELVLHILIVLLTPVSPSTARANSTRLPI